MIEPLMRIHIFHSQTFFLSEQLQLKILQFDFSMR